MNLGIQDVDGSAIRWSGKVAVDIIQDAVTPRHDHSVLSCNYPQSPSSRNINRSLLSTSSTTTGTPGRPGSRTPQKSGGDRFIPCRRAIKFDLAHHLLTQQQHQKSSNPDPPASPSLQEYQRVMAENLNGGAQANARIISYSNKPPSAPEGYGNNLKVLYSGSQPRSLSSPRRKTTRHIPQGPEYILDAPGILDDYYLNLLDWSANNQLAVSLGGHVYLWDASSKQISQLLEMEDGVYVASVSWTKDANCLAVGSSTGNVQLWDTEQKKCLRTMSGHASRVGALSWNNHILASGSRSGAIHLHDVRAVRHHVSTLAGHTQEVCGLRWSGHAGGTSGGSRYLASGANDNLLQVWDHSSASATPLHTFSQHQAAVKALAWCPWQAGLLASGGGTADRHIRFWNCNTGMHINSVDTNSQVCALLWSTDYRELVSSHGYAKNQLILWKYPAMTKVAELTGHASRVLHLAMSPDGSTVVSAAADESLRLWKCFQTDPDMKKAARVASKQTGSMLLRKGIR